MGPIDVSMTLHFIEMGTETQASPPEVVVGFSLPAEMDAPESMSPPPPNQFVERIGKDLTHGSALSQLESRIVPWSGLSKKVKHFRHTPGICPDRYIDRRETVNIAFYDARMDGRCQPLISWSFLRRQACNHATN